MATMAAAGPALSDVTADPMRPQNSQANGGPSSTVPGGCGYTETDSQLLALQDATPALGQKGGGASTGTAHLGRSVAGAPTKPHPYEYQECTGAAPRKSLQAARVVPAAQPFLLLAPGSGPLAQGTRLRNRPAQWQPHSGSRALSGWKRRQVERRLGEAGRRVDGSPRAKAGRREAASWGRQAF